MLRCLFRNEQNSDLADGDDGDEPEAIGPELKRTPSHPPSVLRVETTTSRLDTLLSNKTQPDEPNAEENMIEICKSIIREENRGATHFISSIDLGAKVFYNETVSQKGQRSTVSANAGLDIASQAGGSAEMSRTDQSTGRSLRSDTTATIHPAVVWKKTQTAIEPEQEMVIGCEVSPVWLLVTNKDWRQAMKHACTQYVREHMHTAEHSFPVIATGETLHGNSRSTCSVDHLLKLIVVSVNQMCLSVKIIYFNTLGTMANTKCTIYFLWYLKLFKSV